jgi:hypothetical protein
VLTEWLKSRLVPKKEEKHDEKKPHLTVILDGKKLEIYES